MLRQFAGLWILVFGGLAVWQGLVHDRQTLALVLGGLAVLVAAAGPDLAAGSFGLCSRD